MLWILLSLMLSGVGVCLAQDAPPPASQPRRDPPVERTYLDLWREVSTLVDILSQPSVNESNQSRARTAIKEISLDLGIAKVDTVALHLVYQARRRLAGGGENGLEVANRLLAEAENLAPNFAPVHFGKAELALASGVFGVPSYVSSLLRAYREEYSTFFGKHFLIGNSLVLFVYFITTLLVLLTIGFLARESNVVVFDLTRWAPEEFNTAGRWTIGLTLIFLPVLLGAGVLVTVFFWLLLVWIYLSMVEKGMVAALLLLLLLTPTIQTAAMQNYLIYNNLSLHAALYSRVGGWSDEVSDTLRVRLDKNPSDSDSSFVLGIIHKRRGGLDRLLKAEEYYKKAIQASPGFEEAEVNLANVLFATSRTENARDMLNDIIGRYGSKSVSHYNLARTYFKLLQFSRGQEEYAKAQKMDPARIAAHDSIMLEGQFNREVIDLNYPDSTINRLLERAKSSISVQTPGPWNSQLFGIPLRFLPFVVFPLLVLLIGLEFLRPMFFPAAKKCAMSQTPFIPTEENKGPYCDTTLNLFYKGEIADPEARNRWKRHIRRKEIANRVLAAILTFFAPGAGHVANERSVIGIVLLGIWSLVLSIAAWNSHYLLTPFCTFVPSGAFHVLLTVGSAAALYAVSALTLWNEV